MGYNLTNEQIQNTYQQLVQVSGSTLLNGTGSAISFTVPTASYATTAATAVTASYALNGANTVSKTTFNAYTASNDASVAAKTPLSSYTPFSASVASQLASIVAGSGSADWDLITNKPSGIVTGSSQTLSNLVGQNIVASTITLTTAAGTHISSSGFRFGRFGKTSLIVTPNTSDVFVLGTGAGASQTNFIMSGSTITTSATLIGSDAEFSGNLSVAGTASFGYIQSITGSAKIVGDAFIILNNATPTQPKGGISVVDTGSTSTTSSFLWDGITDDWKYEYHVGGTHESAVALFGSGSMIGTTIYPTANKLQKGTGTHHLHDSNITDTGTSVSISTPLTASAMKLTSGGLTFQDGTSQTTRAIAGLVNGGGAGTSIRSNIGDTNTVSGSKSIGIGGGVTVSGTYGIGIGQDGVSSGQDSIAIGRNAEASNTNATSIGHSSIANGSNATALGQSAAAGGANAVAVGACSSNGTNAVAVGEGATASNTNTQAIGVAANASGNESVALGTAAGSSGGDSIMIGTRGSANTDYSVAVGGFAEVTGSGTGAVALGNRSKANHANGISIGYQATISADNGINIGGIFKYDGTSTITLNSNVSASGNLQSNIVSASGNIVVGGQMYSPVFAGSVASSTSSVDFNSGNFATLSLTAGTFLANPSNLKSGTTYTIIISSGSLISGHGTSWKFSGGTAPTYTNGTDVLTCVSDGTSLYATALTDFQ